MAFYAVLVPDSETTDQDTASGPIIFESKDEALNFVKQNKTARFKAFQSRDEASQFRFSSSDSDTPQAENSKPKEKNPSEGCAFSGLSPQKLKELKEAIRDGDMAKIEALVESNPRYLITPSDTPSVIHSGTRSNALHVAVATGNLKIVGKVLTLIQDPELVARMYPDESAENRAKRHEYLLDMYMNMPKKGDNDTPLHIASKMGYLDVIRLLVSFSSCDPNCKNKEGLTPAQVACARLGKEDKELKDEIVKAASEQVYIPVICDVNLVKPAFIGEPLSPRVNKIEDSTRTALLLNSPRPSFPNMLSPNLSINSTNSDGKDSMIYLTPNQTFRSLFGPLSPEEAVMIKEEWNRSVEKKEKLSDPFKALEKKGRPLSLKYQSCLLEYWDFLNCYCDLRTEDGLSLLDNYLHDGLKRMEKDRLLELEDKDNSLNSPSLPASNSTSTMLSPVSQLVKDLEAFHLASPSPHMESQISHDSSAASFYTANEPLEVYINGSEPSDVDRLVYELLQPITIDKEKFPCVHSWRELVAGYNEQEMKSWRKPLAKMANQRMTPPKFNLDDSNP